MHLIKFGIVGCGSIGPTHAAALRQIEGVQLVGVADVIPERARDMAKRFELSKAFSSDVELINNPDIDAVIFCTPSGVHAEGAVRALRAGKHVVVEKPMEVSLDACDRMIEAERESGKVLSVISQHRFDHSSQLVKELMTGGKLGDIVLADASVKWWRTQAYYDSGDWRGTWKLDGGGALMNQGVHTVDVLQWLAGDVESVYAQTRTGAHDRIEVEDVAVAVLTFKNGAVGTLTATTAVYDGLPARIDLCGTEGTAVIEGDRLKHVVLKSGERLSAQEAAHHAVSVARGGTASVKHEAATRAEPRSAASDPGAVWGDSHRAQLQDFIRAIREGGKPLIDGAEGRKPVEVILAIYDSARRGERVIL